MSETSTSPPPSVRPPRGVPGCLVAVLRPFVMVKRNEWRAVILAALYFFFLLSGYYLLRPLREAMGIQRGYEKLPWLYTGTLIAMLLVNPVFSWIVSRLPRRRFIPLTYRFFALNLLIFYGLFVVSSETGRVNLGYAFYIWLSVYNLFVVSVFWAFMADVFTHEQARRVFPMIGVGGTLGGIAGAAITGAIVDEGLFGIGSLKVQPATLMPISIVLLELAVQSMLMLWRRSQRVVTAERCPKCGYELRGPSIENNSVTCPECGTQIVHRMRGIPTPEPTPNVLEGVILLGQSRYLQMICLYMVLFTITSTYLYQEQGRIVELTFPDQATRTTAFANIDFWTNVLTLSLQLFVAGRLIALAGLSTALALLPALTLLGFLGLWALPGYFMLVIFQVIRRGAHYAIDRPAREVLFTVVGPDAKYKSKSFIDTFVYRGGDLVGAWTFQPLLKMLGVIGAIAAPLSALWLLIALWLGRITRMPRAGAGAAAPAPLQSDQAIDPRRLAG